MSAVDDIRKLLQDLVTPDLKSLEVRVSALDRKVDALGGHLESRVDQLEKKVDLRYGQLDQKVDLTRDLILAEIKVMKASMEINIAKLTHSLDLDRRVAKIENERASDSRLQPMERIA